MPSRLPLVLTLFSALLLPSCVEWRIGNNIRELAQTRRFLDMSETEGGVVYSSHQPLPEDAVDWGRFYWLASPPKKGQIYYARIPVVKGTPRSSTVVCHLPYGEGVRKTTWGDRRTGEVQLIARTGEKLYLLPEGTPLPRDAKAQQMKLCEEGRTYLSVSDGFWYGPSCVLAAPFDYVIDPALIGISTTALWATLAVYAPFAHLFYIVDSWCQDDTELCPEPTTIAP